MSEYQIKKLPSDFKVLEVPMIELSSNADPRVYYYSLEKIGYSTFDAKELIAKYFNIPISTIDFAGLKDEDGHTMQYFSLEEQIGVQALTQFNQFYRKEKAFLRIAFYGLGDIPIKVARLHGNIFNIIIRGLDKRTLTGIVPGVEINHHFINYYDTQRFGRPACPKNTHKIGVALIENKFNEAWDQLLLQYQLADDLINTYKNNPEAYFTGLDQAQVAFFKSAHYSFIWNESVKRQIIKNIPNPVSISKEGIDYLIINDQKQLLSAFSDYTNLNNVRVIATKHNEFQFQNYPRVTLIQTNIEVINVMEDALDTNKLALQCSFFLPKGCYATMAITQLFSRMNTSC